MRYIIPPTRVRGICPILATCTHSRSRTPGLAMVYPWTYRYYCIMNTIKIIHAKESHLITLNKNNFIFSARAKDRWSLLHVYAGYYVICKLQTRPNRNSHQRRAQLLDRSGITQREKTRKSRRPYRRTDNMGRRGVAHYLKRLWCKGVGKKGDPEARSGGRIKELNVPGCYL